MKLPRYTAGVSPPRESGLARATDIGALTRTGEVAELRGLGAMGAALQQVSGVLFKIQQDRRTLDNSIELGRASQRVKSRYKQAVDEAAAYDVTMDMPMPNDPFYLETLTSLSTKKRDELIKKSLRDTEGDVRKIVQSISDSGTRKKFEAWYYGNYSRLTSAVESEYGAKLNDYQYGELEKLALDAAQNGDLEASNSYIDVMDRVELITHAKALALKRQMTDVVHKARIDDVYAGALAILNKAYSEGEDGPEAVGNWLADSVNVEGLTGPEVYRINQQMLFEDAFAIRRADKAFAVMTKETVLGLANTYLKDGFIKPNAVEALEHPDLKERWTKIEAKQTPVSETKDWKAVMNLQDKAIEYLLKSDPRLTEEEMVTQLIEAATAHQQISEKELKLLVEMMSLKLNDVQLMNLKASFGRIKEEIGDEWLNRVSDSEAKRISMNRRAEIGMMLVEKGRKEDDTLADAIRRGIEIDVASRKREWITDDVRYYYEPPPLRNRVSNWMALPVRVRRQLWDAYQNNWTAEEMLEALEQK